MILSIEEKYAFIAVKKTKLDKLVRIIELAEVIELKN